MGVWISTDLDGTLLDHDTYRHDAAKDALNKCAELNIPIVLNTSKTAAETIDLHTQLQLTTPIAVENGSALIFPNTHDQNKVFGLTRTEIIAFIEEARKNKEFIFEGFNDWTVQQIMDHTGLNADSAERASQKDFSEPFIWHSDTASLAKFKLLAEEHGLQVLQGGRFMHLQGRTDKAKPLNWLKDNLKTVFPQLNGNETLVCLGDNHNDIAMLNIADHPICVRSKTSGYPELTTSRPVIHTKGYGPAGWNESILAILKSLSL